MGRISKEDRAAVIDKIVDIKFTAAPEGFTVTDLTAPAIMQRLYSYAYGLFSTKDVSFAEVYELIARGIREVEENYDQLQRARKEKEVKLP